MNETKEINEQKEKIKDYFNEQGINIECECTDTGGYALPSKYNVTVSHKGKKEKFEYAQGSYYRKWNRHAALSYVTDSYWRKFIPSTKAKGKQVNVWGCNLKKDSDINKRIFDEFKYITDPIDPDPADVMYCLMSDYQIINDMHTFYDFCAELGYNNDSIKDRQIYDACCDTYVKMNRLRLDIEKLSELYIDY